MRAERIARQSSSQDWRTINQAAAEVRVSLDTIKLARASGALRFRDVDGVPRIEPDVLRAWARGLRLIA